MTASLPSLRIQAYEAFRRCVLPAASGQASSCPSAS